MLTIKNLEKRFGSLRALDDVSLEVEDDCIVGLIGPNGSGKTTLFNVVSGFYEKDGGEIHFKGGIGFL
jgi:ABC-type branched-subunit amino acid transport system ATPase component